MKPIVDLITDEWIEKNRPCEEALDWWDRKEREPIKILKLLIRAKKYDWANWFIVRVMEYKDYVSYAVYAAKQVIDIYEKEYPNDDRPRKAIEAAKMCIDDPSDKNKEAAGSAAGAAAWAAWAAGAAAWSAARAAWSAAEAAAEAAAWSAAEAAAEAAGAAAWAAWAAAQLKILKYGMKLLNGGGIE